MKLSDKAIQELKNLLVENHGSYFGLSDEELNEVGCMLLTALAGALKIKARK